MAISDPNEFLGMNRAGLTAAWAVFYKEPMPQRFGDATLRLALAYRVQAASKGADLSPAIQKRLQHSLAAPRGRGKAAPPRYQRYLREWNGEMHVVEVVAAGYSYRDAVYRSLSEVARKITGTRWSGPLFFGLKKRAAPARAQDVA